MQNKKEILLYIENISAVVIGLYLFLTPILFTSQFTDAFSLPKQILLMVTVILSILLLSIRMVILGKVSLRSTPFDLPVFLFIIITLLSAIFAVNRYDALINFVPLLFAALLFFSMVNIVKKQQVLLLLISAMVAGSVISGIISIFSYFRIFIFPYPYTQIQTFTTFGSLLDQAIYFALVLPLAGYVAWPFMNKMAKKITQNHHVNLSFSENAYGIGFSVGTLLLLISLAATVLMLVTIAKPLILPLETGFQTAFASISQDTGRVFKSFLLGSGYGTYITDFTRYKQASYNLNTDIWSLSFFRSSTYLLELVATIGVAGIGAFLFIVYRFFKEKTLFLPLVATFIAMLILPFSFTLQALFFVMLAIFVASQALAQPQKYEDLEFYFVAMKKGLIAAVPESDTHHNKIQSEGHARLLPFIAALVMVIFVGIISYLSGRYILSDLTLQRSLVAASQNNGLQTYNLQRDAIQLFPYRDTNYRIFSQTNIALANSLAASQPSGQQLDQQTQQTILTLIQQAINGGRNAVTISPQTAANWNNLSTIYRSLIGFGQNADQFAVVTNQEAIRLDPTNPQQYVNLGGIFYQLQLWDQAQNQFQIAVQLKPDFANAYYNLGHSLESKGDLRSALAQYQAVRNLVQTDQESLKRINEEIDVLQKKIGGTDQASSNVTGTAENQPPIDVNRPETQLPERNPEAEIEGPSPSPSPRTSPSPTPSGATPTPEE